MVKVDSADPAYGTNGNRESKNTVDNTIGDYNRVSKDGTYTYKYDFEGNLVEKFVDSNNNGAWSSGEIGVAYSWDLRNRLAQAVEKDASGAIVEQTTYVYNNDNLRVRKIVQSGPASSIQVSDVEHFVYDGDHVAAVIAGAWTSNTVGTGGTLKNRYLYAPGVDNLLADESFVGNTATVRWAASDHAGSVRDLLQNVSGSAEVTEHREFDSFGNIVAKDSNGDLKDLSVDAPDSAFAFAGREWDDELDLYYNRARWFDPRLGSFVSEDPIGFGGGDANFYRYAGNDPVNYRDPSGLTQAGNPLERLQLAAAGTRSAGLPPAALFPFWRPCRARAERTPTALLIH